MNAEIAHHVAGRVRLRIADIRGSAERARALEQHIAGLPGVLEAKAQPTAASLTIRYERRSEDAVRAALADVFPDLKAAQWDRRYQPSGNGHARSTGLGRDIAAVFTVVNRRVKQETGGLDLNMLLPLSLLVLAAGFFLRAVVTRKLPVPGWYELAWFAFATYMMLNQPPADSGAPPETPADT